MPKNENSRDPQSFPHDGLRNSVEGETPISPALTEAELVLFGMSSCLGLPHSSVKTYHFECNDVKKTEKH